MTPEEARDAILARPEESLAVACAHAADGAALALQDAGADPAEILATFSAFATAKRALLVDLAPLALL